MDFFWLGGFNWLLLLPYEIWASLDSLPALDLTLVCGTSLENHPFHLDFPVLLSIGFCRRSWWLFWISYISVVMSPFSFLILLIWILPLHPLFSLARVLSILPILSKYQLLILLVLFIVFFVFIWFIFGPVIDYFLAATPLWCVYFFSFWSSQVCY